MINTDFRLGYMVRQKLTNKMLQDYSSHIKSSTFDPDKYNGVKVNFICDPFSTKNLKFTRKGVEKVKGEITLSIFNSGSIIITGGNTIRETMFTYQWISKFFDDNKDELLKDFPKDFKVKKKNPRIYYKDELLTEIMSENKKDLKDIHNIKFTEVLQQLTRKIWKQKKLEAFKIHKTSMEKTFNSILQIN